jgi:hypothetical protein
MDVTMLSFWTAMVLLIGALQYAMPQLTRREIFFSVTVAPEFRATPRARQILASYRRGIVIVTLIALVLTAAVLRRGTELIGAALLMLGNALSSFEPEREEFGEALRGDFAQLRCHKAARRRVTAAAELLGQLR